MPAYTNPMMKMTGPTLLLAAATVAAAVRGSYWRRRADWATQADMDAAMAEALSDVATKEVPEDHEQFGYASGTVMRAIAPPFKPLPWYWCVGLTDFEEGDDGLRITSYMEGWASTRSGAHEAIAAASMGARRVDGEPEF